MKLLVFCAIAALCVFAQVARAQDEDMEAAPAPAPAPAKVQEDAEDATLESRYGKSSGGRGRGGSRRGNGGSSRGNGRGQRGNGGGQSGSSYIQNIGVTNKVVPGYTRVLPTVETKSRERHDVRSQSDSYYRQNSASTITQNNRRKQTFIHTHLNQVFYHPRHVNHIRKHHHTTFVKQLFPQVTKIQINQKQKVIEPEKLTIIKYTQDSNFENKVYPTKQRYASKHQQLPTIQGPIRNLGVRNIGSPLGPVTVANNFRGFESGNKGGSGGSYGGKNNQYLNKRAGEDAQVEAEVKPEAAEVKEEETVEKKE